MADFIEAITRADVLLTVFAALALFAMVLTLLMPQLSRNRLPSRMRAMAVEREKMRSGRLSDLKKGDATSLRQGERGLMADILDRLDMRKVFDSEELRDKLKQAGLRGQAPLVAYMFFRLVMPGIVAIGALVYMFFIAEHDYPPFIKLAHFIRRSLGRAVIGGDEAVGLA